jgi:hypothetical protein
MGRAQAHQARGTFPEGRDLNSDFGIRASFGIRHSDFGIADQPYQYSST